MQKKFRSTLFLLFSFMVLSGFSKDERTFTHLLQITATGAPEAAYELIRLGANVNYQDDGGYTALHWAATYSELYTVDVLLKAGADINARVKDGRSSLHMVVFNGWENAHEVAQLLLDGGADPNSKDDYLNTPLHVLCDQGFATPTPEEIEVEIKLMIMLINAGADPNAVDEWGQTPLFDAVKFERDRFVKILIKAGADVNIKDKEGKTPTDLASDEIKELINSLL